MKDSANTNGFRFWKHTTSLRKKEFAELSPKQWVDMLESHAKRARVISDKLEEKTK